jgi:DNA-binding LytR/AlgR family response regulator
MKTILVIEDDLSIRKVIRDFLELQKFTVVTAEDGQIGVDLAKKIVPDLIICDILMPNKDGLNVKKDLGNSEVTATIPFIYLTSQSDRKDIRAGMELGADDYLFKPFKLEELSNAIDIQLEKRDKLIKEYAKKPEVKTKETYDYEEHILLKVHGNPKFIKISTIVFIEADEKYTTLHLSTGEKHLISKSLNNWEQLLPSNKFARIHRSTIVNIEYIGKVEKWFNRSYKLKLTGFDAELFISRRYFAKLKDLFN